MNRHNHYFKDVSRLERIDVYRLLELFEVACPVAQHIVKKALAAGKRGAKDARRDMQDIADSAARWLQMRDEDGASHPVAAGPACGPNVGGRCQQCGAAEFEICPRKNA